MHYEEIDYSFKTYSEITQIIEVVEDIKLL